MRSILLAVLIGSIVATAYSAPAASLQSQLQALMQDADVAKMQKWWNVAQRVISGLNTAVNGEKRAQLESDDPTERKVGQEVAKVVDDLVMRIVDAVEERKKLKREEGEDKEGTGEKCNGGEGGEGSEGGERREGSDREDKLDEEEVMNCIRQKVQEMRQKGDAGSKLKLARDVLKCVRARVDQLQDAATLVSSLLG